MGSWLNPSERTGSGLRQHLPRTLSRPASEGRGIGSLAELAPTPLGYPVAHLCTPNLAILAGFFSWQGVPVWGRRLTLDLQVHVLGCARPLM